MIDEPTSTVPRVPKYYVLKRHLEDLVRVRPAGTALPAERTLAAEFGLSRTSVRQALREMVVEGRLDRVQGRGTFVAHPKRPQPVDPDAASRPGFRLLGAEQAGADAELGERLGLARGGRVLRVDRLLLAGSEPMAVESIWLPSRRFPGLLRRIAPAGTDDLHDQEPQGSGRPADLDAVIAAQAADRLGAAHGAEPFAAATVETVPATAREAELLSTDVGAPLLLLCRLVKDGAGLPVACFQTRYRGDRYTLVLPSA